MLKALGGYPGERRYFRDRLSLGHESIQTTQIYLHAHIALKIAVLAKLKALEPQRTARFEPRDKLLAFLDAL